jgi:hypothetical protein
MDEWREQYMERINSFAWQGLRMRLLKERNYTCDRCKKRTQPLQLHHKTYERLGCERDDDLAVLCIPCHEIADKERAAEGRARSADAYYDARLDGWASKKYGEDWADYDYESIKDEFEERFRYAD